MNVNVVPVSSVVNTLERIVVALLALGSGVILVYLALEGPLVILALFVILLIGFVYIIRGYTAKT